SFSSLLRVPTQFLHRPSHADLLHTDIWHSGQAIAEDPGTFSYNSPGPLGNGMSEARFHNTVTIHETDPMEKIGRFLWLPWTICHWWPKQDNISQAWHDGYGCLPSGFQHARAWVTLPQGIVIIDRLIGKSGDDITLRWHGRSRAGLEFLNVICTVSMKQEWITCSEQTGEGWYCMHYGERIPSWCRRFSTRGTTVFFVTSFQMPVQIGNNRVQVGNQALVLSRERNQPVVSWPKFGNYLG
ncbi:MAG: heparinase II/III-family protein, partial [Syntrophales bacterium LBB04]|nr:heparinase II/III-family protein [Syntrophales bacterium LBB04]